MGIPNRGYVVACCHEKTSNYKEIDMSQAAVALALAVGESGKIPLSQIVPPKVALRTVDKKSDEWAGFVASIKQDGIINPIAVKPVRYKNEAGVEEDKYQVVDGLHRFMGAIDAGLEVIPAQVLDADEVKTLELQIEGNVHKFETRPVQYSKQLLKILAAHPERTLDDQATRLKKSKNWLQDKLRLQRLLPEIQTVVDAGKMPMSSAYILAKMDEDEQPDWVERACNLPPDQFLPQCSNRINELKKLKAGQPKPDPAPSPVVRKRGDILEMYEKSLASPPTTTEGRGFFEALRWAVQMDDASTASWHEEQAKIKAKREEKREAKKAEKQSKKSELPSIDDLLS